MSHTDDKFREFWFESNVVRGLIQSIEDWEKTLSDFGPGSDKLLELSRATTETEQVENGNLRPYEEYHPHFGLRREHSSPITLASWAQKNGMYKKLK